MLAALMASEGVSRADAELWEFGGGVVLASSELTASVEAALPLTAAAVGAACATDESSE